MAQAQQAKNAANAFADAFNVNKGPFADAFKAFGEFRVPSFDFNGFFNAQRNNLEAISAANQVVTEGLQAVARRQAEIAQANTQKALQLVKDVITNGNNPEANAAKQAEFARNLIESSLSNARELAEIASKSSIQAFDVVNKRVAEGLSEIAEAAEDARK